MQRTGSLIPVCQRRWLAVWLLAAGITPVDALADESASVGPPAKSESALHARTRELVESIRVELGEGTPRQQARLLTQPALRFADVPRNNQTGSLWLWTDDGQPAAILEIYKGESSQDWVHVVQSLSTKPLSAHVGSGYPTWAPKTGGIEWLPYPEAPEPAPRSSLRLRQMKDLAQRLSAHEFWDPNNTRYELRLLVQPVYKYSHPKSGVLDGVAFVFTHGTNPEVLLLLEAYKDGEKRPAYRCAFGRLGHAELHVNLEDRELWRCNRVDAPGADTPYWLFLKPE